MRQIEDTQSGNMRYPVAATILALLSSRAALAGEYTFVKLVESPSSTTNFAQFALNPCGSAAITMIQPSHSQVIWSNGFYSQAAVDSYDEFLGITAAAINNSDYIAYSGPMSVNSTSMHVTLWSDLLNTFQVATSIGQPYSSVSQPALSESGHVAFRASLDFGGHGVFLWMKEGLVVPVATSAGPLNSIGAPSISDFQGGTVAFSATDDQGVIGLHTWNDGKLETLYDTNGILQEFNFPIINESGMIAFSAQLDDGSSGVLIGNGGALTPVVQVGAEFIGTGFLNLNNAGDIAFTGYLRGGGVGLFTGSDPIKHKIIEIGDRLDGSIVSDLFMYRECLSDKGHVLFYADLENGRTGIFRADPILACPADASQDQSVGVEDLVLVLEDWGRVCLSRNDVNDSGFVDVDDILLVLNSWGPCN